MQHVFILRCMYVVSRPSRGPDVFITYLLLWTARAEGKNTSGVFRVLSVNIRNSITA